LFQLSAFQLSAFLFTPLQGGFFVPPKNHPMSLTRETHWLFFADLQLLTPEKPSKTPL